MRRAKCRRRGARIRATNLARRLGNAMWDGFVSAYIDGPREAFKATANALISEIARIAAEQVARKIVRRFTP